MPKLTAAEVHEFLQERAHLGRIAMINASGAPSAVPVMAYPLPREWVKDAAGGRDWEECRQRREVEDWVIRAAGVDMDVRPYVMKRLSSKARSTSSRTHISSSRESW